MSHWGFVIITICKISYLNSNYVTKIPGMISFLNVLNMIYVTVLVFIIAHILTYLWQKKVTIF